MSHIAAFFVRCIRCLPPYAVITRLRCRDTPLLLPPLFYCHAMLLLRAHSSALALGAYRRSMQRVRGDVCALRDARRRDMCCAAYARGSAYRRAPYAAVVWYARQDIDSALRAMPRRAARYVIRHVVARRLHVRYVAFAVTLSSRCRMLSRHMITMIRLMPP